MIASIFKIVTDAEGESKITFAVPSSELINVVKLNSLLQKELNIEITTKDSGPAQDTGCPDLSIMG
jgi:hypothetical protein